VDTDIHFHEQAGHLTIVPLVDMLHETPVRETAGDDRHPSPPSSPRGSHPTAG
jgi:hypothetical protein